MTDQTREEERGELKTFWAWVIENTVKPLKIGNMEYILPNPVLLCPGRLPLINTNTEHGSGFEPAILEVRHVSGIQVGPVSNSEGVFWGRLLHACHYSREADEHSDIAGSWGEGRRGWHGLRDERSFLGSFTVKMKVSSGAGGWREEKGWIWDWPSSRDWNIPSTTPPLFSDRSSQEQRDIFQSPNLVGVTRSIIENIMWNCVFL